MAHHSPSYSITMRLCYPDAPGQLGMIASAIGAVDGFIGAVDIVDIRQGRITRDVTVSAKGARHGKRIVEAVQSVDGVEGAIHPQRSTNMNPAKY